MTDSAAKNPLRSIRTNARAAIAERKVDRRALVTGGALAGAAAIGVAGAAMLDDGEGTQPPRQVGPAEQLNAAQEQGPPSTPAPASTPAPQVVLRDLPAGYALVTSPRLPLWGVSAEQASRLAQGAVRDWSEVGAPLDLPVRTVTLAGATVEGVAAAETFADYEALVAGLDQERGGVALVPISQIDARVSALSVDGVDPLLSAGDEANPVFRIAVVGDMIPGRNSNRHIRDYGDHTFPFHKVSQFLRGFDLTVGNLEIILSDTIPPPEDENPGTLDFVCDPAVIEGLKLSGFDAVSLANNHTVFNHSYGIDAFYGTLKHLDEAGMPRFGAGLNLDEARAPWTTEVGGRTVAFIGIDGVTANPLHQDDGAAVAPFDVGATADAAGTYPFQPDLFTSDVRELAGQYDIVIPFFHMGRQYRDVPPPWGIEAAHDCIDAGAAAVMSSHPHAIQGMELYKGKPIIHGLGNFIYDQMFSVETRTGEVVVLTYTGDRLIGLRIHGVEIEDFNQPRLMGAGEQASFMTRFWHSTDRIAGMA